MCGYCIFWWKQNLSKYTLKRNSTVYGIELMSYITMPNRFWDELLIIKLLDYLKKRYIEILLPVLLYWMIYKIYCCKISFACTCWVSWAVVFHVQFHPFYVMLSLFLKATYSIIFIFMSFIHVRCHKETTSCFMFCWSYSCFFPPS